MTETPQDVPDFDEVPITPDVHMDDPVEPEDYPDEGPQDDGEEVPA